MPRPRHKNKAIIRLSSHPLRQSLCFDSKLVVVVVVIGLMETRLKWIKNGFLHFNKTENCPYMRKGEGSILGTFESKKVLKIHIFILTL